MSIIEAAILALLALNLIFSIWQTRILGLSIKKLDHNIAEALPIVIQEAVKSLDLGDLPEPTNPIMSVIAEAIGKNISPAAPGTIDLSRDSAGKFS